LSVYADTSFLVSLYTPDANSGQASAQMRVIEGPVWLTAFAELELTNAFELRLFRRELAVSEIEAARSAFREDLESGVFSLKPLPVVVFEKARQIARKRTARLGTRTLDVLHVAAALVLGTSEFYTFDRRQSRLAAIEGLRVLKLHSV
jgi:predicted nucleic acid-binding protein